MLFCALDTTSREKIILYRDVSPVIARAYKMQVECLRLRSFLFSRWLAQTPAVPRLSVRTTCSSITVSFAYSPPSEYNSADSFELQARWRNARGLVCGEPLREK